MRRSVGKSSQVEGGYILPATALLMIPIMIFIALAVDVGGWTVEANRIQAAADAGALAGAALLPSEGPATTAAVELAAANGYVNGVDGVTVTVTYPSISTIQVSITAPAARFFSQIVNTSVVDITRYGEAGSLAPVRLGSPSNVLGFGPYSVDGSIPGNYWMLEGNDCTRGHYGDRGGAQFLDAPYCGTGAIPNPYWKNASSGRNGGTFYVVTVPPSLTVSSTLMIMDPGNCPAYGLKPEDKQWDSPNPTDGTHLEWRTWDTGGTDLIETDDTPTSAWQEFTECAADLPFPATGWTDKTQGWTTTPFVFPGNTTGKPETHLVQSRPMPSAKFDWNYHALWVKPNSATTSCTSIASASCPTISAEDQIVVGARGEVPGVPMDLYLAEVGPEHSGRTLQVHLWDTGEGMDNIQVIDPAGKSLDFTWGSDDPVQGSGNPPFNCSGKPCLFLDPTNKTYPPKITAPGWGNSWPYNGRTVTLSVKLDAQVDFPSYPPTGNGYWFRVRFTPPAGKVAKEWATFSVSMTGDPIRLTY